GSHGLHRNCSCTYNCAFTDCDTWPDECIRTNPSVGADDNRRTQQRKIRFGIIMCSRAKMRAMRNRYPRTEPHMAKVIDKRLFTDRAFISRLEIPREINRRRWIHMYTATDLCPETA